MQGILKIYSVQKEQKRCDERVSDECEQMAKRAKQGTERNAREGSNPGEGMDMSNVLHECHEATSGEELRGELVREWRRVEM